MPESITINFYLIAGFFILFAIVPLRRGTFAWSSLVVYCLYTIVLIGKRHAPASELFPWVIGHAFLSGVHFLIHLAVIIFSRKASRES